MFGSSLGENSLGNVVALDLVTNKDWVILLEDLIQDKNPIINIEPNNLTEVEKTHLKYFRLP